MAEMRPDHGGRVWARRLIVAASGIAGIGAIALILATAGVIGRVVLRDTGIGRSHPTVAVGVAWAVIVATGAAGVALLRRTRRRWPGLELTPGGASASPDRAPRLSWWEPIVYVAFALLLIWPATLQLGGSIAGAGDADIYMWQGWRMAELMRAGSVLPLSLPDVVYPYGSDLLLSDGYLPSYLGALWNLVTGPILAYNLAVLTGLLLTMVSARWMVTPITTRREVAVICAIAAASAPALAMRIEGHFTFVFSFPVFLLVGEALRTIGSGRRVRPLRLVSLLVVAYLCSIYLLIFGGMAYSVMVLTSRNDAAGLRDAVARMAMAGATALILISPFVIAHVRLDSTETAHGAVAVSESDSYLFSSDLIAIAALPRSAQTVPLPSLAAAYSRPPDNGLESTITPGLGVLLALGVVMWLPGRWRRPLLAAGLVLWLFALGTSLRIAGLGVMVRSDCTATLGHPCAQPWLPYTLLNDVPGLGALRTPDRASFALAAVGIAVLAVALDWLTTHIAGRRRVAALSACTGFIVLTNLVVPNPTSNFAVSRQMESGLTDVASMAHPRADAVVVVPDDCTDAADDLVKLQYFHRRPMVGCQANFASIAWYSNFDAIAGNAGLSTLRCNPAVIGRRSAAVASAAPEAAVVPSVRALGIRYLLVDRRMLAGPGCQQVGALIPNLESQGTVIASDPDYELIDLG